MALVVMVLVVQSLVWGWSTAVETVGVWRRGLCVMGCQTALTTLMKQPALARSQVSHQWLSLVYLIAGEDSTCSFADVI